MSKSIGIYCGHGTSTDGSWDPGTTYTVNGQKYTEADLMLKITNAAVKYLKNCDIKIYNDNKNEINMIKQVAQANDKGVDAFVSIHCDYYKAPTGTMPLYVSSEGKKLAKAIDDAVTSSVKIKSKGLTKRTDLYELNSTNMPACIYECGSIKADLDIFTDKYDAYGKAIAKGICNYLGIKFVDGSTKATTSKTKTYKQTYPTRFYPSLPSRGYFKNGDKGSQVKRLQKFLNWAVSASLDVDGIIGSKTIATVKTFQKKVSIAQDGLFGKNSLAKAKAYKK